MKVVVAPNEYAFEPNDREIWVFLAGSIEQDAAVEWQDRLISLLATLDRKTKLHLVVYNPRREAWDASWINSIENENFRVQVTWELDGIDNADYVLFYFDPATKSPISLLELGLVAATQDGPQAVVCCPEGFWRKGNVDIVCERYDIPMVDTLEGLVSYLQECIHMMPLRDPDVY